MLRTICLSFFLLALPSLSFADIYEYTGPHGTIHLSSSPQAGKPYKLVMHTLPPKIVSPVANRGNTLPIIGNQKEKKKIQSIVKKIAKKDALQPSLLDAVIRAESGFDPGAVSDKGAMGLMQLMPATARRFGARDAFNPEQNIRAGAAYLSSLLKKFHGDLRLAIAAYNAGSQAVIDAGYHVPPFRQTQQYVPTVLAYYHELGGTGGNAKQRSLSPSWLPPKTGSKSVQVTPPAPNGGFTKIVLQSWTPIAKSKGKKP